MTTPNPSSNASFTEDATDLGPQAISVVASITAGISTIVAAQLTKRFPLSFHSSTPRWRYIIYPCIGYFLGFIGLITYGSIREKELSGTLAFMAAPGVPLHGFLWAVVPQTRHLIDPPSTDRYVFQCFRRKPPILLVLTWIPLVAAVVVAGIRRVWQGLAIQVALAVTFLATGSTPEPLVRARESAFGRAGRHIMLPRPGRRDDTIGYTVDLERELLLEPVRVSMTGIEAYRIVGDQKAGRLGPVEDNESSSEVPIASYLDTFVMQFPLDRLQNMTGQMWRTLEGWKGRLTELAMDILLLYGLVERMAYVAYRPSACNLEERQIAHRLNFVNCRADCNRGDSEFHEAAVTLMAEWHDEGLQLVNSEHWAAAIAHGENPVDKPIPPADEVLLAYGVGETQARNLVACIGSVSSFVKYVFGRNEQLANSMVRSLPFYHNRISRDALQSGSIPLICRGLISSMSRQSMLIGHVDGHEWASSGGILRWGGGGYALLDQAYARNSALAYVGQLAVIVVKAILEN